MRLGLTSPASGQPVSATLIHEMMREIKANRPLPGKNTRTNRTPNGTHIEAIAGGGKSAPAAKVPGRFEIALKAEQPEEGHEEDPQKYSATFANPYYDVGGKTYEMPADETIDPPAVTLVGIEDGSIIVLKVSAKETPTAELAFVLSLQELQQQQENTDHYTMPIYKIQGGKVVCDFRTGPISGMGEF